MAGIEPPGACSGGVLALVSVEPSPTLSPSDEDLRYLDPSGHAVARRDDRDRVGAHRQPGLVTVPVEQRRRSR
jgi:hypothetical protein